MSDAFERSFSLENLEYFTSILEDESATQELKGLAEHIVQFYFSRPAETRSNDTANELLKLRARVDFEAFCEYVFELPPDKHHREISKILTDPRRKRALIVFPPGSGKTVTVSEMFPAFWLGQNREGNFQSIGASADMVEKSGGVVRQILEGKGPSGKRYKEVFPDVEPNFDSGMWTIQKLYLQREKSNKDPSMYLVGIGSGAILGSRSDFTILDDVVTPATARSPAEMKKVRNDLHETVMTRLRADARIVCIMTRFGENDLAPELVNALDFEVLHAPAVEKEDPRGAWIDWIPSRSILKDPEPGDKSKKAQWVKHPDPDWWVQHQLKEMQAEAEAEGFQTEITKSRAHGNRLCLRKFLHADNDPVLWPENFTLDALLQKEEQDSTSFRLVMQGDPTGIEGTTYKKEWMDNLYGPTHTITQVPSTARWFQVIDPSVGKRQDSGDYFVLATVAVDHMGNRYVVDVYRERVPTTEQPDLVEDHYKKYPQVELVLIETTAYQYALFAELVKRGVPMESHDSKKNKKDRLDASAIFFKNRTVFLPEWAPWKDEFVTEFTSYPTGKHDDQIDAMSALLEWLSFNFSFDVEEEMEVEFIGADDWDF